MLLQTTYTNCYNKNASIFTPYIHYSSALKRTVGALPFKIFDLVISNILKNGLTNNLKVNRG